MRKLNALVGRVSTAERDAISQGVVGSRLPKVRSVATLAPHLTAAEQHYLRLTGQPEE